MAKERRAAIVVDLGFGDAGKGLVTDYLTRSINAKLVVRFNGGAQAGHNVVSPEGRHHTFAQLGAASFVAGVRTHLARTTVVHPTALAVEAAHLDSAGVSDALARVSVSEHALVVTPYHQAANRLRELARGANRHGSCGVGVGETVADAVARPGDALRAGDLRDRARLAAAVRHIAARKREELVDVVRAVEGAPSAEADVHALFDPGVAERWVDAACMVAAQVAIVDDTWVGRELRDATAVVFEGAQGVLLDEWAGFHPHTTYSTCTFANAVRLLADHRYDGAVTRVGVLRTYLVRHGQGPFPTHDTALVAHLPEPHNEAGPWQGSVRRGWPDALLARYAAHAAGGVDALALTHLDALVRVPAWRVARAYRIAPEDRAEFRGHAGVASEIVPAEGQDLERQGRLAEALTRVTPLYEAVDWCSGQGAARATAFFEEVVGAPVRWTSSGPRCSDVRAR